MTRRPQPGAAVLALVCGFVGAIAAALATPAQAIDYSISGYGTFGFAQSNQSYKYQRFTDDDGTVKRDSVVGLQIDARVNSEIAATVQIKGAPATDSDHRYEASVSWAFLSYRPTNDLLLRVGKQRIPLFLNSENLDVGATYDFLRMPTEMYSLVASNDAIGVSFNKSWKAGVGELSVDGYAGKSDNDQRIWTPVGVPGVSQAGSQFQQLKFSGGGLVVNYKLDDDTFRIGVHRAIIRPRQDIKIAVDYPFVPIGPGLGYYQVSPQLPGPGVPMTDSVTTTAVTAAMDVTLPADLRVISEFARSTGPRSIVAPQGNRGYAAVLRRFGKVTPYVSYAFLRSPQSQRDTFTRLDQTVVPSFVPGGALITATQRATAAGVLAYHQSSWAFGGSYAFSATSKLKAEFLRTHVADVSQLVDSPAEGTIRDRAINVWSLSYSVVY